MPQVRPQPLIAVRDVAASRRWHQRLLQCHSGHGGGEHEQLVLAGELLLQSRAAHEHSNLGDRDAAPPGHGVLLWFEVDMFDAAVARATALGTPVPQAPQANPRAGHREIRLRDPDGCVVVVAGRRGDLGAPD